MLFVLAPAYAQTDKALLHELAQDNKQSIEALVLYPEDARLAILEAAKYPEILIKMQHIRTKTEAAFRSLIENYPRNTQEVFFEISRFPGLAAALVAHQNDRALLGRDLEQFPEKYRNEALDLAQRQMPTMSRIAQLHQTAQGAFDQLIANYPAPAQSAFSTLLGLPEVIDILNEDLRFTVLVGDMYKEDPAWVLHKIDSLQLVVAREQADELDSWQNTVNSDPQAREELQAATQEYAQEYGYTDEVYGVYTDDLYAEDNPANRVVYVERYYAYNYPYWFGYPWWAPQPCWRPYPYWWYWGFYPYQQTVVIVQLPSSHFMHWYFDHPYHHHRYNRLSTHFVQHYYGHRSSGSTISMGVGDWRDANRDLLSDEWLSDNGRLPARLKEYAVFEQQREQYNAKNPGRAQTPVQFLEKNTRQYPDLSRSRAEAQTELQRERLTTDQKRREWDPATIPGKTTTPTPARVPKTEQPQRAPEKQPSQLPRVKQPEKKQAPEPTPTPSERPVKQQAPKLPDIEKARDYHRDKWQEPRQPAPAPQVKPKAPAPTKQAPKPKQDKTRQVPKPEKKRGGR